MSRIVAAVIGVVVVLAAVEASITHAQGPPPAAGASPSPIAVSQEPAVLKIILDAGWKLDAARLRLPKVQVAQKEELERQDWTEYVYNAALRLYVTSDNNTDIFAVLVDTREPRYAGFNQPLFAEHYHAYRDGSYVVVVPVHPVNAEVFSKLKTKMWTEEQLRQELGAPSFHEPFQGGSVLTYAPQGLSFMGDEGQYQLESPDMNVNYETHQRNERESVAKRLLGQRNRIDRALTKQSPDGRFAAGIMNFGDRWYTTKLVVREKGKLEQWYDFAPPIPDDLLWLDAHTLLVATEANNDNLAWESIDVRTCAVQEVERIAPDMWPVDFGVSGPGKFWYTTRDGQKHEVTVPNVTPDAAR